MQKTKLAPIKRGEIYELKQFAEMSGLGPHVIRRLRRMGLRTKVLGRLVYVSGDDFHDFFARDDVGATMQDGRIVSGTKNPATV